MMKYEVLYALWFFLPAGAANVTPILISRIPVLKDWDYPFDSNRSFRGQRIFGPNKTWRGVIAGTLIALVTFYLQQNLAPHLGDFSVYLVSSGYTDFPIVLGILLGFGALFGDSIESFFKRQRGIRAGESWIAFDQIDYIVGSSILSAIIVVLPIIIYIWIFIIWFLMHLIFSYIGYRIGLKKTPL